MGQTLPNTSCGRECASGSPNAFDRALAESDDVRGLFNHDPDNLLGRTSSGTMRLSVDKKGLLYETDPGDTNVGRDVVQHIKRGDRKRKKRRED